MLYALEVCRAAKSRIIAANNSAPRREVADHCGEQLGARLRQRLEVVGAGNDGQFGVRQCSKERSGEIEVDELVAVAGEHVAEASQTEATSRTVLRAFA